MGDYSQDPNTSGGTCGNGEVDSPAPGGGNSGHGADVGASAPAAPSTAAQASDQAPATTGANAAPSGADDGSVCTDEDAKEVAPDGAAAPAGKSPYGNMFGADAGKPYDAQNNSAAKAACAPDDDACRSDADTKDQSMAAQQIADKNPDMSPADVAANAQQVSDIRMGNTDIQVDPNGSPNDPDHQRYVDSTVNAMEQMQKVPAGADMLKDMADTEGDPTSATGQHTTTIQPPAAGADQHTNANTGAEGPSSPQSNGTGADPTISYDPTKTTNLQYGDTTVTETPDRTLDHEMTHAYHEEHGDEATGAVNPVAPNDACLDSAEYQAVGLKTNTSSTDYSNEPYTENEYAAQQRAAGNATSSQPYTPRPAYVPDSTPNGVCGTNRDSTGFANRN